MRFLRVLPVLLLGFLVFSCSTHDATKLRVLSPLPTGVVPRDSMLTFTFSRGVVAAESTNVWNAAPLVEFTPALPGKFSWVDTSRLVFSPDAPFPGDARIHGKFNTALLVAMSQATGFSGDAEFDFSTEPFTLRGGEFFYDRMGEARQVGIKANLEFSYAVDPRDLGGKMQVSVDGTPQQDVRIMTPDKSRIIAVELGVVQQLDKERKIAVAFSQDLVSPETSTKLTQAHPFEFVLAPLGRLQILGHEAGTDGTTGYIRVRTNQEVDAVTAKKFIHLEPNKEFTVVNGGTSFTIKGNFTPGTSLRLTIAAGLESVLGGTTSNAYEADVYIGNLPVSFRFGSSAGTYMLLGGERKLEVITTNLRKLNVRVSQVFQNNLVYFLQGGRYYDYDYYDYEDEESGRSFTRKYRYVLGNYGRQLSYDSLALPAMPNQPVTTMLDLNPYLHTGYKGFYLVEIASTDEPWRTTSKLVSVSDLGIIAKQDADGATVFVTNLGTTEPVSDALVTLMSRNNQVVGSGRTNRDGMVHLTGLREKTADFPLQLITAEREDDFNFIALDDYLVETSRYDVGGKHESWSAFDAMLYGDRALYRPGETINVSGIVRNLGAAIPSGMPVKVKVLTPRGSIFAEQQLTLNGDGSFETKIPTRTTSLSGDYPVELLAANGSYLAGYKVSVEDFMPDRLRVNLTASAERVQAGATVNYTMTANNFFGPPAANRSWQFEGSFDPIPFASKAFPDFRFSDDQVRWKALEPVMREGKTDASGSASFSAPTPSGFEASGLLRLRGRVAVFDESGRPVYQMVQTLVDRKPYYIGLQYRGPYYVSPGARQGVKIVAVDPNDHPIAGFRAHVQVVRFEWHSVLRQSGGNGTLRYVSERREIVERDDHLTLGSGPADFSYDVQRSGEYAVRVGKEGESGYTEYWFYSYSGASTDETSFEIDPEARVEIVLDKTTYAPGDKARVLFQTPFNGRMLVTVERSGVFFYKFLEVKNNAASLDLTIEDQYLPNVYISAVLFRSVKDQRIPLLAGHGFVPLMVEKKANHLEVKLSAPAKIKPRTRQAVTITVPGEKAAVVTLAAVDEGILQIKNYKSPDPYGYFYARKALETSTHDFFKHLLPEPAKKSSTGGSDAELGRRVNPLSARRVKPVAIWSGLLRTNDAGQAQVTLDIPDFNGEVRLMAVAYKGDRFGAAAQPMTVADPVVITPTLPRFLSPDDSLSMAISAFNTTGSPVSLKFDVKTTGGLRVTAQPPSLTLEANRENYVLAGVRAGRTLGKATVTVKTSAPTGDLESTTELPVRPASPIVTDASIGVVEAGATVRHAVPDVYFAEGRRAYVTLSPFPVGGLAGRLKELLGYPYGCVEQITSKAFPQIYLRDLVNVLAPNTNLNGSPTYYVNEAITILNGMQTPSGLFTYWPGGIETNSWGSVYATHFLLEARKAGYVVSDGLLKGALTGVAGVARGKKTADYSWYQDNKVVVRRIADKSVIYALYVLALAGNADRSTMDFYRTDRALLTTDTRTMLAVAYALSGDRKAYLELVPGQFSPEEAARTTGGCFDSPIRANALILGMLLDADPGNPAIPRYMEYLSQRYQREYWFSTQDDAFTMIGLGKAARIASGTSLSGTVSVGGKQLAYKGGTQRFDIDPYGKEVVLSVQGTGRAYYAIVTEGIRTDGGAKQEDRNLRVRREFLDRSGNPLNIASVQQNTLVVVRVRLTSSVDLLENVAVSDLLPAGFEVENPRLTEMTSYPFIKDAATPEYLDVRDDRINFYLSFRPGGHRERLFYYAMRAVSPGRFTYAPIVAETMYSGEYHSVNGGGTVSVTR